MSYKVFIQARMSSNRLPGKVLMPFGGKPIIRHVVDAARLDRAVVLTSLEPSDDPLVAYLKAEGITYFRGSLNDVYGRFCDAINHYNLTWVMRICADSPLIPAHLLRAMENIERGDADIITNVHPRSFPKGHSVEIIRAQTMLDVSDDQLTDADREHVTPYFYRNADRFKIISVTQPTDMSDQDMAVDTREDYDRLNSMSGTKILYDPARWEVS
ncbi:MAG: flagellin modification protein FlmC [Zetaproteobacteria bacterium]|nr:MAG: flagellin modification protein FlmC [Zetaproteobacteria bacterium]